MPEPVPPTNGPRAGIVTTVREPGPPLISFLRHHLAMGFAHVFVFFDDPADPWATYALRFPQVTIFRCDRSLREEQRARLGNVFSALERFFDQEVMARQMVNAELAIDLAAASNLNWLLHIDVDELFWCEGRLADHLAAIPRAVGRVTYLNAEGVAESLDLTDYFSEVTLFKRNPMLCTPRTIAEWMRAFGRTAYFTAYENGKSAVRIAPGATTDGVHSFKAPREHPLSRVVADPMILHYPNCGFQYFWRKYQHRGAFSDTYFGQQPRIRVHLQARDAAARGEDSARAFFVEQFCLSRSEIAALTEAELATRVTGPQRQLQNLEDPAFDLPSGASVARATTNHCQEV
jgi:hypothetical protein